MQGVSLIFEAFIPSFFIIKSRSVNAVYVMFFAAIAQKEV